MMIPLTKLEFRDEVEWAVERHSGRYIKFNEIVERIRELSIPGDCIRTADLPMMSALADVFEMCKDRSDV